MPETEERGRSIAATLRANYQAKERKGDDGEIWLDHFCLFHNDRHKRSATFQPETGVYHCWAGCGTRSLEEVERRFGIHYEAPLSQPRRRSGLLEARPGDYHQFADASLIQQAIEVSQDASPPEYLKIVAREINYLVTWPDGTPSHVKRRFEYTRPDLHPKEEFWYHPDGETKGKPKDFWPIYDCSRLPRDGDGYHVFVVEGLKKVDRGNDAAENEGVPARFLTVGTCEELKKYAETLAEFLQTLPLKGVLLWPDNDRAGLDAMKHVQKVLERYGL